ncbi:MAG: 4Fe-4S binding protein [Clostridia bacterium]|nr:4Fe-4S binding protein [Clostridia bacterium]
MKKTLKEKLASLIPTKRRLIQLYAALLTNAHLKGYITGDITENMYKGDLKAICSPGLNCYSCPGAVGACPLGSLQNSLAGSGRSVPYYIFGILLLYGIILGRWICGFLCPFGLVQDLLHKIKTPKLKKSKLTKALSYLKYVILVLFVFIIPLFYMLKDVTLPSFCKYICPAGTLGGAIGMLLNPVNHGMLESLGPLFTWKFALMCSFIVGAVFIYRIFCRFICPLGAIYGLFNRFSILGIKLEKKKCIDCGLCISKCKMDISHVGDHECIMCGECIPVCPTKAISWSGSKIILPENEIESVKSDEALTEHEREKKLSEVTRRRERRVKILKITASVLMVATLATALIYYNFFGKNEAVEEPPISEDTPTFNPRTNGKVTVVNFWYTDCQGCKAELPHFDKIAKEYSGRVDVVAIHADDFKLANGAALEWVNEYYSDYDILFLKDGAGDAFYNKLLGSGGYPMTLVVADNGVIVERVEGEMTEAELRDAVERALANTVPPVLGEGAYENFVIFDFELEYLKLPEGEE